MTIPTFSISWSLAMLAESPFEIASNPGACGELPSVSVSAARTISASAMAAGSMILYFLMIASKLQYGPSCVSSTFGTS
jgi:hypothetical protein